MTTLTLDAYEAEQVVTQVAEELIDTGREEGRIEALEDVEAAFDGFLLEVEERITGRVEETLQVVGTWVSNLHIRLGELEQRLLAGQQGVEPRPEDDDPDVDVVSEAMLWALDEEREQVEEIRAQVADAVNALAKALFTLGETSLGSELRSGDTDDEVECAYWTGMKALASCSEWLVKIGQARDEWRASDEAREALR